MKRPGDLFENSLCFSKQRIKIKEGGTTCILHTSPIKIFRAYLVLILSLLVTVQGFSQTANDVVSGRVTDSQGGPLPGVTIKLKGSTTGTSSDTKGNYKVKINSPSDVLVFSFLGFNTIERPVGTAKTLNVQMRESSTRLEDVVVNIGYGTARQRDITGSVSTVKGTDIVKNLPVSINEGLQGMVSGVQVGKSDGAPGAGINIVIRGANSVNGSEPLYVVDDIPVVSASTPRGGEDNFQTVNGLSFLNPQDVESIEILKDASATAIYGSRGSNGVVLITTKKGKSGRDRVNFISNSSFGNVTKKIELMNAYEFALLQNEATANYAKYYGAPLSVPYSGTIGKDPGTGMDNVYRPTPEDFRDGMPEGSVYPVGFTGENWQDRIFRTSYSQDFTLQASGGNDKGNYSISGNYLDQQGIILKTGFKRYGVQLNLHRNVSNLFQIGTNTNITYTNYVLGKTNTSQEQSSIIRNTLMYSPAWPFDDPYAAIRQERTASASMLSNPVTSINDSDDRTASARVYTTGYAQLNFLPFMSFRQRVGYNYNINNRSIYYKRTIPEGYQAKGRGIESEDNYRQLTLESLLNFNKTFNRDHRVDAVTAFTYEKGKSYWNSQQATNFPNDIMGANNLNAGLSPQPLFNYREGTTLMSVLARAQYSYKGKYTITGNFRRDGSSKFSTENQFANFGSVAVGWLAGEERFIKSLNLFSNLKLRASLGTTGNQGIGPYAFAYQLRGQKAPVNLNGDLSSGFVIDNNRGIVDPDLRWETTRAADIGLDMGFMKNRITVTVEGYHKRSSDLLQSIKVAPSTGFQTTVTNLGTITNKGLEFSVYGGLVQARNFKWNVNGNFSINRNEVSNLPGDQFSQRLYHNVDNAFVQRNGYALGSVYGVLEDGFYDNEAEVRADPTWAGLSDNELKQRIGTIKYKDVDGDGIFNKDKDRTIIGNTLPDYMFGLTNSFNYKRFDFTVFVHGSIGGDLVNTNLWNVRLNQNGNGTKEAFDGRWTEATKATATWPAADASYNTSWYFSNRYVEDGSFVRLKTISLGYTFKPRTKLIEGINVYGTLSNVFTITNYSWYDPDVNSFGADVSRRGVDMNSYPNTRTFTLGVKAAL
ncbi:SusC/RagA family TonB-linked outer membrane protein [Desertivirga arenae]|uniref:SusC/RagA family TonB-linked outer membrane protein n=1 Tax=Desertivirga arenae TaxID=2810309 RepID=UPI001A9696BC|nr:TonB-dependent receptor [Pedobacter sp. SYSU D00823]